MAFQKRDWIDRQKVTEADLEDLETRVFDGDAAAESAAKSHADTVVAQAAADVFGAGGKSHTAHLDTLTTRGTWQSPAAAADLTAQGWPVPVQSIVVVYQWSNQPGDVMQVVMPRVTAESWRVRTRYQGTWYGWTVIPKEDLVKTLASDASKKSFGESVWTGHLDTLGSRGVHQSPTDTAAMTANGWPVPVWSVVMVLRWGATDDQVFQVVIPRNSSESWQVRTRYQGVWSVWSVLPKETRVQELIDAAVAKIKPTPSAPSPASRKSVPLSLTLGQGDLDAAATGSARYPIEYTPRIGRYRVHVRNINPEVGTVRSGASLTGLWVGPVNSSGHFTAAPTQIGGAAEVPANTTGYTTDWVQGEIGGGGTYAVSLGWTSTSAPVRLMGYGWTTGSTADATALAPALTAVSVGLPFHVWIEAEVPATVPTIAMFGSSSASGQGATRPLVDSVVSRYARANGALPIHYTAPGSRIDKWLTATSYKWTGYPGTDPADAVLWNMGSNDAYQGDTLATMQTETQQVLDIFKAQGVRAFYAANIPPRLTTTTEVNTVRQGYNTWLVNSDLFRDVFDYSAALSTNDSTMTAGFDSGDGVHYNDAGHTATLNTMVRPIVAPPVATQEYADQAEADAVTTAKTYTDQQKYVKPTLLTAGQDLDALQADGLYKMTTPPTDWAAQHMPRSGFRGEIRVTQLHTNGIVQTATEWTSAALNVYSRVYVSGTWYAWNRLATEGEVAAARYVSPSLLGASTDWDTLKSDGLFKLSATATDWAAQHLPKAGFRGELRVTYIHVNSIIQTAIEWTSAGLNMFSRVYVSGTWYAWSHVGGEPLPASGLTINDRVKLAEVHKPNGHELERDTMAAYYGGVVETNGAAPLALVWDDYPTTFRDALLPLLDARGLVATLAVCSQTFRSDRVETLDPVGVGVTRTTWAQMDTWSDRVEFANHSQTHLSATTIDALTREIVTGRDELRALVPSRPVFTWVQPAATYDSGFNNGADLASYTNTTAGRLQLGHHGYATGTRFVVPGDYTVPARGKAPDGLTRSWVDSAANLTATRARVDQVAANGRGLIISGHATRMTGTNGEPTVADITAMLDQIATLRDQGKVRPVFLSEFAIADSRV